MNYRIYEPFIKPPLEIGVIDDNGEFKLVEPFNYCMTLQGKPMSESEEDDFY